MFIYALLKKIHEAEEVVESFVHCKVIHFQVMYFICWSDVFFMLRIATLCIKRTERIQGNKDLTIIHLNVSMIVEMSRQN
jgi:hypothetical protein